MNEKKKEWVECGLAPEIGTIVVLALVISTRAWTTDFAGGTGEANDPYQIATAEQLIGLGEDPSLYDRHFMLVADIDLAEYTFTQAVIARRWRVGGHGRGGADWQGAAFSGYFNGNGFLIQNLRMQGNGSLGLFGVLASGACISGVALQDIAISGHSTCVVGGLAGINDGLIIRSTCIGSASGDDEGTGGIVGQNHGVILGCHSSGAVRGDAEIGGLAGINRGIIVSSYCSNVVSGHTGVGGLVSRNVGNIISCYSTGAVDGRHLLGGLSASNSGYITSSYSTGTITSTASTGGISGRSDAGGLVGHYYSGSVIGCFWDVQSSGVEASAAGTGLTTDQMRDSHAFLEAGWDFVNEISNGTSDYWQSPEQAGPPVLSVFMRSEPILLEGQGRLDDPYVVTTASDLGSVWYRPWAHYRLGGDIELAGISWTCAVIPWFSGHFNGNGFVIRKLQMHGAGYLGLFGQIESDADVSHLGVLEVDIAGEGGYVGAMVGGNQSSLIACRSSGTVCGSDAVGGLAGYNLGHITSSNSTVTVSAEDNVGGLVGSNLGDITRSYSNGMVSGSNRVGGLAGRNSGNVTRTYSAGVVRGDTEVGGLVGYNQYGKVSSSFWDVQASGLHESAGGMGLTGSQMQDQQTFMDAGWDFVGETRDGLSDIWTMPEQGPYPILSLFHGHEPQQPAGLGTMHDPFLLTNAFELGSVWYRPLAYYRLDTDIDLAGITWNMAVIPRFNGHFDGNGFHIQNLRIQGEDHLGVFGKLGSSAQVHDLGIMDVNIIGTDDLGSLAGSNLGRIVNCSSSGTLSGESDVGGLVGANNSSISTTVSRPGYTDDLAGSDEGSIVGSNSTCTVSGTGDAGGLVGENNGAITNSYSSGAVSGETRTGGLVGLNQMSITSSFGENSVSGLWSVGGLAGQNEGSITTCYSTGKVSGQYEVGGLVGRQLGSVFGSFSTGAVSGRNDVGGLVGYHLRGEVTSSFWDIQSSGWNISAGGEGLMTADMMDPRAYFKARWYLPDVWVICEGWDHPRLLWEDVTCSD